MQRQIHRLEQKIQKKDWQIQQLTNRNKELEKQLKNSNAQIQILKTQAKQHFSYQYVPQREITETLEAKIASSTWQINQLQKTNQKFQDCIIKLQSQLITRQQQLAIRNHQFQQFQILHHNRIIEENNYARSINEWEKCIKEKQNLIQENLALKNKLKQLQSEKAQKMNFYLDQVKGLTTKLKTQHQNQKQKFVQFEGLVNQLKKQNEQLRQTIQIKNQQLIAFYDQSKLISSDKASDMHTIRNLKKQLKRKGKQFYNVLLQMKETSQLKKKITEYNKNAQQSITNFNMLYEKNKQSLQKIGRLEGQLRHCQQKIFALQNIVNDANYKLVELLTENQVCHELLYQTRGYSDLYSKDIQDRVNIFLTKLKKRVSKNQSWRTVSQLININQKLRRVYNLDERDI